MSLSMLGDMIAVDKGFYCMTLYFTSVHLCFGALHRLDLAM